MKSIETLEKSMLKAILNGIAFRDWYGKGGRKYGKSEKYLSNKFSLLKTKNKKETENVKNKIYPTIVEQAKKEIIKQTELRIEALEILAEAMRGTIKRHRQFVVDNSVTSVEVSSSVSETIKACDSLLKNLTQTEENGSSPITIIYEK
ncbi:MAG: hypothetical protein ACRCS4_00475 [Flavobacterium sp.]